MFLLDLQDRPLLRQTRYMWSKVYGETVYQWPTERGHVQRELLQLHCGLVLSGNFPSIAIAARRLAGTTNVVIPARLAQR